MIKVKPFGEHAIWVQLGQDISPNTHRKVMALQSSLGPKLGRGISYFIPAYHSLTIGLDITQINQKALIDEISGGLPTTVDVSTNKSVRNISVPVCYDDTFALDLDEISRTLSLTKEGIVQLHTNQTYDVFMLGFLPGFPYMGTTDQRLNIERKSTPRLKVPSGSVGLAGRQTGIYPSDAPGGWQIIGQTPVSIFDANREEPFLFQAGDRVHFTSIGIDTFHTIQSRIAQGDYTISDLIDYNA